MGARASGLPASPMTVLVTIPAWRAGALVQKAVDSALAQTYRDVRVVVVGDGEEPMLRTDPRVTVYTLPENRGTYFCRQLMLLASPHPLHAPLDADDWLDPDHVAFLASELGEAAAVLPRKVRGWVHGRGARVYGAGRYHVGLLRTDAMRAVGGYAPEERIGSDTLMIRVLSLTAPVRSVDRPTYNRVRVPTSLTLDPSTSHRSVARRAMKARNREVFRRCRDLASPDAIRDYREQRVPPALREELGYHVERLASLLAERVEVAA